MDEFLSIKEFANKAKAHPNTIRRAIKKGRIAAINIGTGKRKTYRIAESETNRIALLDLKELVDEMVEKKLKASS